MKKIMILVILLLFLLLAAAVFANSGGTYYLDRYRAGSGGELSGGGYTMQSAIGQPEAGVLSGGDYTVGGGFWGGGEAREVSYEIFLPAVSSKR